MRSCIMTEASSDSDLVDTSQSQKRSGFLMLICITSIIIQCNNLNNQEKEYRDRKNQRRKITQSK